MKHTPAIRACGGAVAALALLLAAAPASAQFQPRPLEDPATGESYHIEAAAAPWFPSTDITVASEGFGIPGTVIDFRNDLGLEDKRLPNFKLVLRPGRKHKLRFEFIPIKYQSSATLRRRVVFNGIAYNVGLPVRSDLDWKAYRFGYEFDFVAVDRGFAGFIVEAKYTDVNVALDASPFASEFAHAQAPIPAIGGIGRFYVVPNISMTFELTAFKLPDNAIPDTRAHYVDFDLYGTLNINNYVGAQVGYRSLDVGYLVETDSGDMKLRGMYFGIVARY